MNIRLGNLERGKYREVEGEEYDELMRLLDAQPDTEHETGNPDIYERAERRSSAMAAAEAGRRPYRAAGSENGREKPYRGTGEAGREKPYRGTGEAGGKPSWRERTGAAPRDEKTTAARFENQKTAGEGQKSHLNKAHKISIARRPKPEEEEHS